MLPASQCWHHHSGMPHHSIAIFLDAIAPFVWRTPWTSQVEVELCAAGFFWGEINYSWWPKKKSDETDLVTESASKTFHLSSKCFSRILRFSLQPSTSAHRGETFFPSAYCTFNPFEGHSAPIRHRPQTIKLKILGLILETIWNNVFVAMPTNPHPPKKKGFLQSPTI